MIKESSVFERHQLRIARDTLKMNNVMAGVMGGMTKQEAKEFLFDRGLYSCPPPLVQTTCWTKQSWISYIDKEGKWG